MEDKEGKLEKRQVRLSRRGFLRGAGIVAAGVGASNLIAACTVASNAVAPAATPAPSSGEGQLIPSSPQGIVPLESPSSGKLVLTQQYPEVPFTPAAPPPSGLLRFFSPDEAKTVDALVSRILPGSPEDPGAHEAEVLTYIDNYLSFFGGAVSPTYRHPPFAAKYEGNNPPKSGQYQVIYVKKDELPRYGHQSAMSPAEQYRVGIGAVDAYSQKKFGGKKFADLSSDQQDQVIGDMANGKMDTLTDPTPHDFFGLLRTDVMQGMFSDPVYGGNKDMVGWKLVGYPGSQRAYTPEDIHNNNFYREPQSIAQLMPFSPGEPSGPNVILPVSGFDQQPK